ncbi:putative Zn-dependent protease [Rubricella aquisinus]|uniref:Putative Zn-dependent protease n=1 Tax=Rubricella aquisinus TaxID=2028108 RepID=A0A840WU71_9RHOB|nr:putative Zn-dependent protease [Rubricella aquisinus]
MIRDTEVEQTLRDMTDPLLRAAAVNPSSVRIRLVQDDRMNAFVSSNRTIYIHTGLIQRLDRADMLQAVIAHEIGHITGGHMTSRALNMQTAGNVSALGIAAGALAGVVAGPEAGIAIATGTIGSAQGQLRGFTRTEESAADQTGARILDQAGIDPQAAIDVLDLFAGQELLSEARQDLYARTHPISSDRITFLQRQAATARSKGATVPPAVADQYARLKAKLDGFIDWPSDALSRVPREGGTIPQRITRAVALHRVPDHAAAIRETDMLLMMEPNNPYFHELKGQFLFESGQIAASVAPYRRAMELTDGAPLIAGMLGRALVALDTDEANAEALRILTDARQQDDGMPLMLRALAIAHARAGNEGQAALATAEFHAARGSVPDARRFAENARSLLPQGTPAWIRAEDLLREIERIQPRN